MVQLGKPTLSPCTNTIRSCTRVCGCLCVSVCVATSKNMPSNLALSQSWRWVHDQTLCCFRVPSGGYNLPPRKSNLVLCVVVAACSAFPFLAIFSDGAWGINKLGLPIPIDPALTTGRRSRKVVCRLKQRGFENGKSRPLKPLTTPL